jgi:uncharacterized protein (DUF1800 family)
MTKDPAMLFWLDNYTNRRLSNDVGTNENYARELHELFSLGVQDVVAKVPSYTEQDVRQASRALTGWSIALPRSGDLFPRRFFFNNNFHDPGPYTHLGNRGGNNANFIFDNIVQYKIPGQQQSTCGRFIGYRLFKFFGSEDPEPEIINALAAVFDTGTPQYNIKNMLRTIFTPGTIVSEAFYSERAFTAHIKSPTEFLVSSYRLLKPDGMPLNYQTSGQPQRLELSPALAVALNALNQMGQLLFVPPDVSGWKEGSNWINTTFDLGRFNLANGLITIAQVQARDQTFQVPSPITTASLRSLLNGAQTPEQVVDVLTHLLLQVNVSTETRTTLVNYLQAGADGTSGGFNFDVSSDATIDNKVRGLIHLIMSSPEYQLS